MNGNRTHLQAHAASGKIIFLLILAACGKSSPEENTSGEAVFPSEIVDFIPYPGNPVFAGTAADTWDENIRERGYILREADGYHLWYTGYKQDQGMYLGYATSPDGLHWKRHDGNPVFNENWTEDMMVIKSGDTYYLFAEGLHDVAHLLTSKDKIHWADRGSLQIQCTDGKPLSAGPYGTPTAWIENGVWYLFYERNDEAIWLASSTDLKLWKNVQDEPVLKRGPEGYDKFGVALNQVIRHQGRYYAYYHGTAFEDWSEWSTNVAVSENLRDWKKYGGNPIMKENKSSGILVHDGSQHRLYTMHPSVCVHFTLTNNN